jgi:hypothetical protein
MTWKSGLPTWGKGSNKKPQSIDDETADRIAAKVAAKLASRKSDSNSIPKSAMKFGGEAPAFEQDNLKPDRTTAQVFGTNDEHHPLLAQHKPLCNPVDRLAHKTLGIVHQPFQLGPLDPATDAQMLP